MRNGGIGGDQRSTFNGDAVDVGFKLRSALKIAFDINAHSFDKEVKIRFMLKVF